MGRSGRGGPRATGRFVKPSLVRPAVTVDCRDWRETPTGRAEVTDRDDLAKDDTASKQVEQSIRAKRLELSEEELTILGSLMEMLLRGGQTVLLTEELHDVHKRDVDPSEYLNAIEMTLGVRPRNLDTVIIRKLMGSVISHWVRLKASLGLITADDMGIAIHHAAAQFANAYPFTADEGSEHE